jgi:TM2 domain.
MPYCSNCGSAMEGNALFCVNCGDRSEAKNESFREKMEYEADKLMRSKDPFIAAILSFVLPGLGQVYNGDFKKGLMIQICFIFSFIFSGFFFLLLIPLGIWLFGVYDAYTEAEKIRNGELPNKNATLKEILIILLWPFVLAAVLFVLILILIIILAIIFLIFGLAISVPYGIY